ncbi:type II toxin-antitoxin system VapC family toxin [Agrobacterium sp. a22-2]|uniref:type II toxin-antitoxin system VapC family toxin n=1 Tax=Agrobacterium sp. a22-2 TaxID=2283840 RepID=UPI001448A07B|nr:type II toxin-antitoxin system VapC family toxin [Agrobacterium sp. a22-2]NKN35388.1 type II toxin-antitoxin system VapC family toxin [Agrobacterium sp. a22-2]
MNGYLLDTNVISMLSPSKADIPRDFLSWMREQDARNALYLSVVTIQEIEKGQHLLEAKGATAKAEAIRLWLRGLVHIFQDRILPIDMDIASIAGGLEAQTMTAGHNPGMADALIAGTAKARGLVVVTWNTRHFLPFSANVVAPTDLRV